MQPAATTMRQRVARLPLDVVIVGAGIGGLAAASSIRAAGHRVHILEAASGLREAGAGMQLAPNATRILQRWGLGDQLQQVGVEPQALVFRRCESSVHHLQLDEPAHNRSCERGNRRSHRVEECNEGAVCGAILSCPCSCL